VGDRFEAFERQRPTAALARAVAAVIEPRQRVLDVSDRLTRSDDRYPGDLPFVACVGIAGNQLDAGLLLGELQAMVHQRTEQERPQRPELMAGELRGRELPLARVIHRRGHIGPFGVHRKGNVETSHATDL
jgi:hypothetical protein